ncbi:hypothetical protein HH310_37870 [Actinoplanes sp. TBRC 11911]|uniref:hypothetical protein n=1 Tax=Actinoplanes sp. TBRC 11911 TaxID=2729386 RepID=UPI00145F52E0|nr:hypothetical protein [Actinoplanes sp. TBRC 11911]NMO56930.1 hypothetical protein [Actinoplanes sp. TBRC 11911]
MPDFHIPDDPQWQWVYDLILYGVGEQFPKADPSALRDMGNDLYAFTNTLLGGLSGTANLGNALNGYLEGPAADAFNTFFREITKDVPSGGDISNALGGASFQFALDSESTQYAVVIAAFTQVVEIAIALSSGFGAAAVPGLIKIGQEIVGTLIGQLRARLRQTLMHLMWEAIEEGLEEVWQGAAGQLAQILEGNRKGIDYKDLGLGFAGGVFIGGGAAGVHAIGGKFFPKFSKNIYFKEGLSGAGETGFEGLFSVMLGGGGFNGLATFSSSILGGMAHHWAQEIGGGGHGHGGPQGAGALPPPPTLDSAVGAGPHVTPSAGGGTPPPAVGPGASGGVAGGLSGAGPSGVGAPSPSGAGASGGGSSGAGGSGAGSSGTGSSGAGSTGAGPSGAGSSNAGSTGAGSAGAGSAGAGSAGAGSAGAGSSNAGSSGAGSSGTDSTGAGSSGTDSTGAKPTGAGSSDAGSAGTGSGDSGAGGHNSAGGSSGAGSDGSVRGADGPSSIGSGGAIEAGAGAGGATVGDAGQPAASDGGVNNGGLGPSGTNSGSGTVGNDTATGSPIGGSDAPPGSATAPSNADTGGNTDAGTVGKNGTGTGGNANAGSSSNGSVNAVESPTTTPGTSPTAVGTGGINAPPPADARPADAGPASPTPSSVGIGPASANVGPGLANTGAGPANIGAGPAEVGIGSAPANTGVGSGSALAGISVPIDIDAPSNSDPNTANNPNTAASSNTATNAAAGTGPRTVNTAPSTSSSPSTNRGAQAINRARQSPPPPVEAPTADAFDIGEVNIDTVNVEAINIDAVGINVDGQGVYAVNVDSVAVNAASPPAAPGGIRTPSETQTPGEAVQTPSHAPKQAPMVASGSADFQNAQRRFGFHQVVSRQIGTTPPRTANTEGLPTYLATVPATVGTNLDVLIGKYREGFADGTMDGRFGLVIGVNGFARDVSENEIRNKVNALANQASHANLPFPVRIVGFQWSNSAIKADARPDQATIPYAAIRESLIRHPDSERMLSGLIAQGDGAPAFIHTGDADILSATGDTGPMFNLADTVTAANPDAQMFSGGYRFGAGTDPTAIQANQRDRAVRDAMAQVDSRSVYLPEPNTLIRVSDGMTALETDITFGVQSNNSTALTYTSKEGRGLAESVKTNRGFVLSEPHRIAVFDSALAITTESDRLLQNYDPSRPDSVPQSHADKGTWVDQVQHLIKSNDDYAGIDPGFAGDLGDIAFHSVSPVGKQRQQDIQKTIGDVRKGADKEAVGRLVKLARDTNEALKNNPLTTQTPSSAPPQPRPGTVTPPVTVTGDETGTMPRDWQAAYDNAEPKRLRTERFVPAAKNTIAFGTGKLRGENTTIDFRMREFTAPDGTKVRAFDVHLDLVSRNDAIPPEQRAEYGRQVQQTIGTMVNGKHTLADGHRLHVNLTFDTPPWRAGMLNDWDTDPKRNPPVEVTNDPAADVHQHLWSRHDTPAVGVHEVMHYLGAKEGYTSDNHLFRGADRPGVMGSDVYTLPVQPGAHGVDYLDGTDLAAIDHVSAQAGPVREMTGTPADLAPDDGVQTPSHAPKDKGKAKAKAEPPPAKAKAKAASAPGNYGAKGKEQATTSGSDHMVDKGSTSFRNAQKSFRFAPLTPRVINPDPPARPAGNANLPTIVATVPATTRTNLGELVDKYAAAFRDNSDQGRFALVIGLNGNLSRNPQAARDIQREVGSLAVKKGVTFPVVVVPFTWDGNASSDSDQKSIPYGAIRETIIRHDQTQTVLNQLRDQAPDAPVFVHIGDSDVHDMTGVFEKLTDVASRHPDAELISGGYRLHEGKNETGSPAVTAEVIAKANTQNDADLALREEMAKIDGRLVYLPEPNTFLRMRQDSLEKNVTFGVPSANDAANLLYTSKEGLGLADSLLANRKDATEGAKQVVFDASLALTTDGRRLLQNFTGEADVIPQSHLDRNTWQDQVQHLVAKYPADYPGITPETVRKLADMAFQPATGVDKAPLQEYFRGLGWTGRRSDPDHVLRLIKLRFVTEKAVRENLPAAPPAPPPPPPPSVVRAAGPAPAASTSADAGPVQTPSHAPRRPTPGAGAADENVQDDIVPADDTVPAIIVHAPDDPDPDPAPVDLLRQKLPRYLRDNQSLGMAQQVRTTEGEDLSAKVRELAPGIDEAVLTDLTNDVRHDLAPFVGAGRPYPVTVNGKPAELVVTATLDFREMTLDDETARTRELTSQTRGSATNKMRATQDHHIEPRTTAWVTPPAVFGAGGSIPTAPQTSQANMHRTTFKTTTDVVVGDQRAVTVPVTFTAVLRTPGEHDRSVDAARSVGLTVPATLTEPDPLPERAADAPQMAKEPPKRFGVESVVGPREDTYFDQVAEMLDEMGLGDVTRVGSHGRTVLRNLFSDASLQWNMGRSIAFDTSNAPGIDPHKGWVTSDALVRSPRGWRRLFPGRNRAIQYRTVARQMQIVENVEGVTHKDVQRMGGTETAGTAVERPWNAYVMGGAGLDVAPVSIAVGPRVGVGRRGPHTQDNNERANHTERLTATGPAIRYQTVYELQVRVVGHPPRFLRGNLSTLQWTTPDRARGTLLLPDDPGRVFRKGDDRQYYGPTQLEHGRSFGGAIVNDLSGGDKVYSHLLEVLRDVPGHKGLKLDRDTFLKQFGDETLGKGLSAGVQAILSRDATARTKLSNRHLRYLLDRMVGPGLEIPLVKQGRMHDYTTIVTIKGKLDDLSDGPLSDRGAYQIEAKRHTTAGTTAGRDTSTTGELSVDAYVLGQAGAATGGVFGGPKVAVTRTRGHDTTAERRTAFDSRYGALLTPDGDFDDVDMREFQGTLNVQATMQSSVRLNANMRRLSVGRPGHGLPEVVAASARELKTFPLKLKLLVPEHRVSETKPPARTVAEPPRHRAPIEQPPPLNKVTGGYSHDLDGARIESFIGLEHLQDAVRDTLVKAADDPIFRFPDGRISNAIGDNLSPERLKDQPEVFSRPISLTGLTHQRRADDAIGNAKVRLRPTNPRILPPGEFERVRRGLAGGSSARDRRGWAVDASFTAGGFVSSTGPAADDGGHTSAGGARVTTTITPWQRTWGGIKENMVSGLTKVRLGGRPQRRVLVQVDVDAEIVAEARHASNLDPFGLASPDVKRAGARMTMPDAVLMWLTMEQVHRMREADLARAHGEADVAMQHRHGGLLEKLLGEQGHERERQWAVHETQRADLARAQHDRSTEDRGTLMAAVRPGQDERESAELRDRQVREVRALADEQERARADLARGHDRQRDDARFRQQTESAQLDVERPAPPVDNPPAGTLPPARLSATDHPSFGIGGISTPVDLGDRIEQLRQRLADEVGEQIAHALLPDSPLEQPHDNVHALRTFLAGAHHHAAGAINGGPRLPLRLEGRFGGHTYHVTLRAAFGNAPAFVGVEHVDELTVTDRATSTTAVTNTHGRTLATVAVAVQGQGLANDKPADGQPPQDNGHGPATVAAGGGLAGSAALATKNVRDTKTGSRTHEQSLTVRGPVATYHGDLRLDITVTGHGLPAEGVTLQQIRPVDVHQHASDRRPDGELGKASAATRVPLAQLGDDARKRWRTDAGADSLPEAGRFAVEHLFTRLADLHQAAEDALRASGVTVDENVRTAIRNGLTPATAKAGLPVMRDGTFRLPIPAGLGRELVLDARLLRGPAFVSADADVELGGSVEGLRLDTVEETSGHKFGLRTNLPMVAGGVQHPDGAKELGHPGVDNPHARHPFAAVTDRTHLEQPLYATNAQRMGKATANVRDDLDPIEQQPSSATGDDPITRNLAYRIEYRLIARSPDGRAAAGVEVAVGNAAAIRMDEAAARERTGTDLPPALRASATALADAGRTWTAAVQRRDVAATRPGADLAPIDAAVTQAETAWWQAHAEHDQQVAAFAHPPAPEAPMWRVWDGPAVDYDAQGRPALRGPLPDLAANPDREPVIEPVIVPRDPATTLVLAGDDEPAARLVAAVPGHFTVVAHGTRDGVVHDGRTLTPAEVAAMIQAHPSWAGQPVVLIVCDTGAPDGFAQQLAGLLPDTTVVAPDGPAWTTADGAVFVTETVGHDPDGRPVPRIPPTGTWRRYRAGADDGETGPHLTTVTDPREPAHRWAPWGRPFADRPLSGARNELEDYGDEYESLLLKEFRKVDVAPAIAKAKAVTAAVQPDKAERASSLADLIGDDTASALEASFRKLADARDWTLAEKLGLDVEALKETPPGDGDARSLYFLRVLEPDPKRRMDLAGKFATKAWLRPLALVVAADKAGMPFHGIRADGLTNQVELFEKLVRAGVTLGDEQRENLPYESMYFHRYVGQTEQFVATGRNEWKTAERLLTLQKYLVERRDKLPEAYRRMGNEWEARNGITVAEMRKRVSVAQTAALVYYTGGHYKLIHGVLEDPASQDSPADPAPMREALLLLMDKNLAKGAVSDGVGLFDYDERLSYMRTEYQQLFKLPDNARMLAAIRTDMVKRIDEILPGLWLEMRSHADMAVDALRALPPISGITVFRAHPDAPGLTKGAEFSMKSVASTSRNGEAPKAFMTPDRILLELRLNGYGGRDVQLHSSFMEEEEILLAPGSRFRILDEQLENGIRKIIAEEIEPIGYDGTARGTHHG